MSSRRNVVVILAHGLRADAIGEGRTWGLATPGIQRLALRGLNLVATSACPADPGGMLSLLTGLHVRQHGFADQLAGPVMCRGWAARLAEVGYTLAGAGLIGPIEPLLQQTVYVDRPDVIESTRCEYLAMLEELNLKTAVLQQRQARAKTGPFFPERVLLEPVQDIDGFITSRALEVLEQMPTEQPWALVVSFSGPGNELPPPAHYDNLVDAAKLQRGFAPPDFRSLDVLAELDYPRILLQRMEPHQLASIRNDYLGRVSMIDYATHRLSALVDRRPDAGRTWIVLASDHGTLLGEHGLIGHRSFLAPAVETPLIVAPPHATPQALQDMMVSTVDVAATIAAIAGVDLAKESAGRSLLPLLAGQTVGQATDGVISEFGTRLMMETPRYKVIFNTESRQPLGLYDMLNDPQEAQNTLDSPTGQNILDSLRWKLGDMLLPMRATMGI